MSGPYYFDYAAATPLDQRVLAAMQPYFTDQFYNPSALYDAGRQAQKTLQSAREQAAVVLGVRPSEVVFTAGGTESTNLAIHGVMRQFNDAHLVVSSIEHDAVLQPAKRYNHDAVAPDAKGIVQVADVVQAVTDKTVLVSVMYANNEIGSVQPIKRIADALQQIRDNRRKAGNTLPLYFHTDACQAAEYLDLHAKRLGVDLLTINGGKIYGPKQSGLLYVRGGIELVPLLDGGGQESGLRSGTENVAACVGLAMALEIAQSNRKQEANRLQALQRQFFAAISRDVPSVVINGSQKMRLPNNLHITIPGYDNERLLVQLDEAGIQAAAGSACSASSDEPSHVLQALGLSARVCQSSLRFTMGRQTTEEQVQYLIQTLKRLTSLS